MTQVQVDYQLQQKLGGMTHPVELFGPDGQRLGRFLPESEYPKILYGSVDISLTDEELARRSAEPGGCSLDEIWKRVGRT
jgi:hypothetical protein